jgi:glycosyltransferase involved in cell wall biosynthesis
VPTVAVVIPSYNHAQYIGAALESVAAQTLAANPIVVVDDGSTDASLEVIQSFATKHPQLRLIPQANAGAHIALNRAIEAAGEVDYVAILNSDDLYEPARLERCVAYLEAHPECAVVATGLHLIGPDGAILPADHPKARRLRAVWADPKRDPAEWLGGSNFAKTTSNFVIRGGYARAHPLRDYRYVHDYFFAVVAAVEGAFGVIAEPLLRYRTHPTNTIKVDGTAKVARETVRLNFDLLRELSPRLSQSPQVRAAYSRYFRALAGNAADFRLEPFLALAARLAASEPEALRCWLDELEPADYPELAAAPGKQPRLEAFRALVLRSRWVALGTALGLVPQLYSEDDAALAADFPALERKFRRCAWVRLGLQLRFMALP